MRTLTFNYAGVEIYIPEERDFCTFVGILARAKSVDKEELKELEFEVKTKPDYIKADPYSKEAVLGRENAAEEEIQRYHRWWTEETKKTEELQHKLDKLQAEYENNGLKDSGEKDA